jgi:uncharacterized membrane protein HdeD (DUF308 family)
MLAGALVVAAPWLERLDGRVFVAGLLLLVSALHLAFAWPFRPAPAVLWQVLLSVAYGGIGLYLLGRSALSVDSIRLPVAAYLLADGLLEWGLLSRAGAQAARPWLILDAITTIVIAVMAGSGWPSREGWALAALIGINVFLGGLTRLVVSLSLRRLGRIHASS